MTSLTAVTGAAGYVGSRLVQELGHRLHVAIVRAPVPYLPANRQASLDLSSDTDDLTDHLKGATTVVHLAGHNEVVAVEDPARALTETQLAAHKVAHAAAAAGVKRLVYVSTVHVYGRTMVESAVLHEGVAPEPTSIYAIARLASEHLVREASGDLETVVLRLTNAVGAPTDPRVDRWTLVASDLCRQAARNGELRLQTPGTQWRDFIALSDVCTVLAAATEPGQLAPGTYNLGTGHPMRVRDLAGIIQDRFEALSGTRPPLSAPPSSGAISDPYHVAVDRLAEQGLRATATIEAAIDELARFCLEHERPAPTGE